MRDYGKIFTSLWSSETFRSMSEDGRSLVLYLLSSPHGTIAGAFRLPDGYVREDMQWSSERVSQGFAELFRKGFANRCETTKWVWVCKHFEWNPPENPNQRKSAQKIANQIPIECAWKNDYFRVCGPILGLEIPEKTEPLLNPLETVSQPVTVTGTVTGTGAEKKIRRERRPPCEISKPAEVAEQTWVDWLKLRKAKNAPVTQTALDGAQAEASKAALSLEDFLKIWCRRGSQGLEAAWLKPEERRGASAPPNRASSHAGFAEKDYREGIAEDGTFA